MTFLTPRDIKAKKKKSFRRNGRKKIRTGKAA